MERATFSALLLAINILLVCSTSDVQLVPDPFNETEHLLLNVVSCQEAECMLDWSKDETDLPISNCSFAVEPLLLSEKLFGLFSAGKTDVYYKLKDLIEVFYKQAVFWYCPNTCTVGNLPHKFWLFVRMQIEFARVYADPIVSEKLCRWNFDFCKSWSYGMRFMIYFGIFALPSTIILNFMNISTITKLISSHRTPAASLYFHKAEIYTDLFCSIVYYLWTNLFFFTFVDQALEVCVPQFSRYISIFHFSSALMNLLTFVNQGTLYNLVSDRCAALKDPLSYDTFNGHSIASKRQMKTILISILLFSPLLLIYLFYPLFEFWREQTEYLEHFISILTFFYALTPLICVMAQILKAIQYQKLFEAQLNAVPNAEGHEQTKKNENEKRLLLIGTVGLNIVASSVGMFMSVFASRFVRQIVGAHLWWYNVLFVLSALCIFMNGTGSFIIHVILLQPYRAAFWETKFGKFVNKIVGESN